MELLEIQFEQMADEISTYLLLAYCAFVIILQLICISVLIATYFIIRAIWAIKASPENTINNDKNTHI